MKDQNENIPKIYSWKSNKCQNNFSKLAVCLYERRNGQLNVVDFCFCFFPKPRKGAIPIWSSSRMILSTNIF